MKKIILAALLLAAFATSAMAAFTGWSGGGGLTFAASNSVSLEGDSASTGYVFEARHNSGSRLFITDSIESKIYWKESDPTAFSTSFTAPASSTAHGTPNPTSGYTAL